MSKGNTFFQSLVHSTKKNKLEIPDDPRKKEIRDKFRRVIKRLSVLSQFAEATGGELNSDDINILQLIVPNKNQIGGNGDTTNVIDEDEQKRNHISTMIDHIDLRSFFEDADLKQMKDLNSNCREVEWQNT